MSLADKAPIFALCGVGFLSSFSRFTHGKYTPWWFAFQESHRVDDGTQVAAIIPMMDLTLALLLIPRHTRLPAAVASTAFLIIGLTMQVKAGKEWSMDALLVGIGTVAVLAARRLKNVSLV
ncbi:hypothetical protein NA57DRAFT_73380 [Rhizodiscina lignyota]|uniref:Uncharacterized protein n=1 Tax=Rhizodiscina lignyota TaxID=1504668 RepID=A0A9P4IPM0_9PEZI|nr:hypothetical protein NA57DRAFT_73380 [Rhizodiscina lignyota]